MRTVKATTIGDSVGIIFPPEVAERLDISDGVELQLSKAARDVELTRSNDELAQQFEVAKKFMEERHEVFRKLAE